MYRYAQLGDGNFVVGISNLAGEVDNPNLIKLEQDEDDVELGDIYDPKTKTFERPKEEEVDLKELIDLEDIQKNQLTTMEALGEIYLMLAMQGMDMTGMGGI